MFSGFLVKFMVSEQPQVLDLYGRDISETCETKNRYTAFWFIPQNTIQQKPVYLMDMNNLLIG